MPPSRSVTTGVPSGIGSRSRYSSITPAPLVRAGVAGRSFAVSLDAHHRGHVADDVQLAQVARRSPTARRRWRVWETTTSWASSPRPSWRTVWIETSCSANAVRDRGQHAGAVVDVERDVVAGQRLAHRQHRAGRRTPTRRRRASPASRLRATVTRSPSTALAVGAPPAPGP